MKEVIIETGRYGGGCIKGEVKTYQKEKQLDFENSSNHKSMRNKYRGYDRKSQGDKLSPVERFLRSNIGRKWDDVYAEICEVNDIRSLVGFHLLTHLKDMVIAPGLRNHRHCYCQFFADEDGILQEVYKPSRKKIWARNDLKKPITDIIIEDGWHYTQIKGIWYGMKTEEIKTWKPGYWYGENKEFYIKAHWQTTYNNYKFQCNKKELKRVRELVQSIWATKLKAAV